MFCTHCGTKIPDEESFCSNCGKAVLSTPNSTSSSRATLPQPPVGEQKILKYS